MKLFKTLFTFIICLSFTAINAQNVDGKLLINKNRTQKVNLGDPYVVNLFKDFKTDKHEIMFSFDGNDDSGSLQKKLVRISRNKAEKPEFSFFTFKTTVKHNGKTIGVNERKPMPYIPGDMFLPAEAFDFISILGAYEQKGFSYSSNSGALPNGDYEIILEAIPVETKGSISSARFSFKI